jgi:multidrug resistance efflux pump
MKNALGTKILVGTVIGVLVIVLTTIVNRVYSQGALDAEIKGALETSTAKVTGEISRVKSEVTGQVARLGEHQKIHCDDLKYLKAKSEGVENRIVTVDTRSQVLEAKLGSLDQKLCDFRTEQKIANEKIDRNLEKIVDKINSP